MKSTTKSQKGIERNTHRLNHLRRRAKDGKSIYIRSPLPGIETMLASLGIDTKLIYIPDANLTDVENKAEREKHRGVKAYIKGRELLAKYNTRGHRVHQDDEELIQVKRKILQSLQ